MTKNGNETWTHYGYIVGAFTSVKDGMLKVSPPYNVWPPEDPECQFDPIGFDFPNLSAAAEFINDIM
ncbi:hypothetical protein GobsT_17920 [Gemmata obscuriglobus]|uniref:Uncharacterized protein n=1 Tax=Gemmata obscuriglobus TaxID=114 RepID=A0A2Z3H271_9BACT|nr:hypothetical protein [Gemmata obscuriglobus]AWM39838.1 hypothetical protein C1280_24405 [Gemmata obscuriglobus]QEG27039.1 hypothetical protein GobsT_17920 [Gemmata obscuriglobus]VTS03410.1 unnamed protein product [Gemmata obscuriglobus UQM 2246]